MRGPLALFERIPTLGIRIFLVLFCTVVVPIILMLGFIKTSYERFIEDELSEKIVQSIARSEEDLYSQFTRMINISNVLSLDSDFLYVLASSSSYYQKSLAFDKLIGKITVNDPSFAYEIKVTLLDRDNRAYANWSLNFNDYAFLLSRDFVKASIAYKGHVTWGLFTPAFIREENQNRKYISLARSLNDDSSPNRYLCTFIVSVGQENFSRILSKYLYDATDSIFIATSDGEVVFALEGNEKFTAEYVNGVLGRQDRKDRNYSIEEHGGSKYLVSHYTLSSPWTFKDKSLRIYYFTDYQGVLRQLSMISNQMNAALIGFFFIVLAIVGAIALSIVRPVRKLSIRMDKYEVNQEPAGLDLDRSDEIGHINRAFLRMSQNISDLFDRLKRESLVKEQYYFESLRAQLNPHFLFNTLTTIRWMALIRKADNIVESIDALANILKYSMNKGNELVSLREELENIESYLALQNYRYGGLYSLEIRIPEVLLPLRVIKFILQPIVENAVIYAFKGMDRKGIISIHGRIEGGTVLLFVEDNGRGADEDSVEAFNRSKESGHRSEDKVTGIGLINVDERIRSQYGAEFGIWIGKKKESGTIVTYRLPILGDEAHAEETADR